MVVGFWRLAPAIEAPPAKVSTDGIRRRFGLGRSKGVVLKLSVLFSLDAFGGGFIPQSLMAYWFHIQYGADPALLGLIFFGANLLAAVSSLLGGADRRPDRVAQHDGLHPPAVERPAHPRPADADPPARDRGPVRPVQPQPDGRPDAAVLRHGRRRPGRAVGCRRA